MQANSKKYLKIQGNYVGILTIYIIQTFKVILILINLIQILMVTLMVDLIIK